MNKRKVWKILDGSYKPKKQEVDSEDVERLIAAVQQECYWDDRDVETWDAINSGKIDWSGTINEKKIKKKQKRKQKTEDVFSSSDGIQYAGSFTYDSMDPGELKDIDISFDPLENVTYDIGQVSFDFDKELRKKYPALQDALEHYQSVRKMCESREKEESDD